MNDLKVIFLDIDGVLNCDYWYETSKSLIPHPYNHFSPDLVDNLNRITKATGAKIVLSSTWRKNRTLEELRQLFVEVGIEGELIDKTIELRFYNWTHSVPRGCEIYHWIDSRVDLNHLWRKFVIIDDDTDMMYWHKENVFTTDPSGGGLTANIAYRITNFLNGF
jgi:hypothetical protein